MLCLKQRSHVSNLNAKHRQINLEQRVVNRSQTWVQRKFHSRQNEGMQRCITLRSARVVKPLISIQNVVRVGNVVVLDEKNPHIPNFRDGTTIKL